MENFETYVRAYMPAHTRTIIDSTTGTINVQDSITSKTARVDFSKKLLIVDSGIREEIPEMLGVLLRAL